MQTTVTDKQEHKCESRSRHFTTFTFRKHQNHRTNWSL